mgnify:CR=1 FL=1
MILQNIVFPNIGICTEEKMFFKKKRIDSYYNYENNVLMIAEGDIVQFNTYFNAFLADKWGKYTSIDNCNLWIKGTGAGILNIYRYSSMNGKELVLSKNITLSSTGEYYNVCAKQDEIYGIIYWEYEAHEKSTILKSYFSTSTDYKNEVSLGVVITTFKREKYVERNMNSLKKYLFNEIDDRSFHIFIIDNGQTLQLPADNRITVIPNKNYGGAGGFGRGMLEIYKQKKYNHVIFCDDDAVYEPEAFLRLFNFLSYAKDSQLCVGGSMLKLDNPSFIYESGAKYSNLEGRPNKNMLDMTEFNSLVNFNHEEYATYHAWWFFCCPITCVQTLGFPIPIFFQMDDVEYSLRLRENNYITTDLNGICVWHESFQRKSSTATNYYWVRNEMIVSSLHNDISTAHYIKWFTKYFIQSLFVYRYDRANMMLLGAKDALKGPEFLMKLDPSIYHQKLLKRQVDKPHDIDKDEIILEKYDRPVRNDKIKKFFMSISLNGMLLPSFLRNKGKSVTDKGYVIEPLQGFRASANFRKETILYVDIERMSGFIVHRDPKKFWKLLSKMIKVDCEIFYKFSSRKKAYRAAFAKMKSLDFWENYVGKE